MKRVVSYALGGAIGLAAMTAVSTADAAEFKMTASSSHPPVIPWVATIKNHVVPESAKRAKAMGHEIKWTEAYAGALYNFQNTLEGVETGLGDVAWVGTLWEPEKLPLYQFSFFSPFGTSHLQKTVDISNKMFSEIDALPKSMEKYNQVYLGPQVIDGYVLISTSPVKSVADLKGKKYMTPGAVARWLEGTGAVGVNGGLPVYYNNMKTGVADGAIVPGTGVLPFKLYEVAPYWIQVGLGGGYTGSLTINKDTYDKLPQNMREMFHDLGNEYGDLVAERVAANRAKHEKLLGMWHKDPEKKGAQFHTLSDAERKKWAMGLPNLAGEWVEKTAAKGLPAKQVMSMWMKEQRAAGENPVRDWDKEL